jgi:cellulose synthase/poly-beta-1,6-N-acetylglucosamine synthase-like glycosyltransferase
MGGWSGKLGAGSDDTSDSGSDLWTLVLLAFLILCYLLRWTRLIVGCYANLAYKAFPIPASPTFTPSDCTIVIPTVFAKPSELAECIGRVLTCGPRDIFVVLLEKNVAHCRALCHANGFTNVTVLGVPKLGKRTQILRAMAHVTTELVVFADDDVFWPTDYLEHLVAIFDGHDNVGAGGTLQRVRRSNGNSKWPVGPWAALNISYLERRVWNNLSTMAIDGSISTLSGRSAAYRTKILKCDEFTTYFTTDSWRGRLLNSDDDKCLTRYVYSHGWEIAIQRSVCLETTLEESSAYIHQCLRWARARYRGNMTVMGKEQYWYKTHLWGLYAIYFSMTNVSLVSDFICYKLLTWTLASCSPETRSWSIVAFFLWLLFTKTVRMIPHFLRHPSDMFHMPLLIVFGYYHSIMNVYAALTLTQTAWGGKDLTAAAAPATPKDKAEIDETTPLTSDAQVDTARPDAGK